MMQGELNTFVTQQEYNKMIAMIHEKMTPERLAEIAAVKKRLHAHPEIQITQTKR